jgi:hypothetical protein
MCPGVSILETFDFESRLGDEVIEKNRKARTEDYVILINITIMLVTL